jgi:cell fate (sporulation/competence/biofilm development) regulator YlbF (YheA/YmcA/DUF963 family)
MNEGMIERARELGRMIGQTEEYKALGRARQNLDSDREAVEALNKLAELEAQIASALRSGQEPSQEAQQAYESSFGKLQGSSVYQALVAAQSNFDKLLGRVNDEIGKGIELGAQSRIILS